MKITNELRSYITAKVNELVPDPTTKEDADAVHEAAKELSKEYEAYMLKKSQEFIKEASKKNIFKGCVMELPSHRTPRLCVSCTNTPAVLQYESDFSECEKFRQKVEQKIIALLSVQKEVSDLDTFIVSVINSIN